MAKTVSVEPTPGFPGSLVVYIQRKLWCDILMMMVQGEPKWTKQIQAGFGAMLNAQIHHLWFALVEIEEGPYNDILSSSTHRFHWVLDVPRRLEMKKLDESSFRRLILYVGSKL